MRDMLRHSIDIHPARLCEDIFSPHFNPLCEDMDALVIALLVYASVENWERFEPRQIRQATMAARQAERNICDWEGNLPFHERFARIFREKLGLTS